MKTKNLLGMLMLFLFTFIFISCDKDDLTDKVEAIRMHVSAETDTYTPWGSDTPVECMLVKEEGSANFSKLPFNGIDGFVYKKGYAGPFAKDGRTIYKIGVNFSDEIRNIQEVKVE